MHQNTFFKVRITQKLLIWFFQKLDTFWQMEECRCYSMGRWGVTGECAWAIYMTFSEMSEDYLLASCGLVRWVPWSECVFKLNEFIPEWWLVEIGKIMNEWKRHKFLLLSVELEPTTPAYEAVTQSIPPPRVFPMWERALSNEFVNVEEWIEI